jgi:hypothetical protein
VRPYDGETISAANAVAVPPELEPVRDVATGLLPKISDEKSGTTLSSAEE